MVKNFFLNQVQDTDVGFFPLQWRYARLPQYTHTSSSSYPALSVRCHVLCLSLKCNKAPFISNAEEFLALAQNPTPLCLLRVCFKFMNSSMASHARLEPLSKTYASSSFCDMFLCSLISHSLGNFFFFYFFMNSNNENVKINVEIFFFFLKFVAKCEMLAAEAGSTSEATSPWLLGWCPTFISFTQ